MSPKNLEKFKTKEEVTKVFASAFKAARTYQPAIFYFDDAEQIFVGKLPKGTKKQATATRLRKLFTVYKNLVTPQMRILFIGCTNNTFMKESDYNPIYPSSKKPPFFDKCLYFGLPSSSDRHLLWKTEISKRIGFKNDLEYDVLAQMSTNFSWRSIIKTIDYTLTPMRLERAKFDPVRTEEFISYLSKTEFVYSDSAKKDQEFLYKASGLEALHEHLNLKRNDNNKSKKK